jgi:hypothetical protein
VGTFVEQLGQGRAQVCAVVVVEAPILERLSRDALLEKSTQRVVSEWTSS